MSCDGEDCAYKEMYYEMCAELKALEEEFAAFKISEGYCVCIPQTSVPCPIHIAKG
jgi:hypothetical protein